jgi:prepilin-type N-terminal cleavage/methylation domain-containing protein
MTARPGTGGGTGVEERMTMKSSVRSDASGFSLVELTVALVVTLIISSAIYGLLAGGQSAFRREPELADRQQQARVAMDLIMKDVANAGSGLPTWVQIFTRNLDACSSCPNGGAPMGVGGNRSDELELLTNDSSKDNEPACHTPGDGNSSQIRLVRNTPPYSGPVLVIFMDGTWTMMNIVSTSTNSTGASNCDSGASKTGLNFNSGAGDSTGMNGSSGTCQPNAFGVGNAGSPAVGGSSIANCPNEPVGPGPCCQAAAISFTEIIRYRIRNDTSGVPMLERGSSTDLSCLPGGTLPCYQTVARGVEDLQVRYTNATGAVSDGAPLVVANNWGSLVTQVQVTLSSRSEAQNIQGSTADANLGNRMRGRLTWAGSPRSTLIALAQQPSPAPSPLWR